jgi:solute:Na+ symporter, SSS family
VLCMSLDLSLLASEAPEAPELRLDLGALDLVILFVFFVWVIGIGFALKRLVTSSLDFFLSGRSLPAWVTGLAFISANLGAIEILGFAASGAQYGVNQVHYYWIAAIPAMVFLGIVMMPFYYGSKVRSVPEYMRLRYDKKAHLINAVSFVAGSLLIAGVNLFALATVLRALLGLNQVLAVVLSAGFVLSYPGSTADLAVASSPGFPLMMWLIVVLGVRVLPVCRLLQDPDRWGGGGAQ